MIKAVIFDFDGTLSDRLDMAYHAYHHLFRKYVKMDFDSLEYEGFIQDIMNYDMFGTVDFKYRLSPLQKKYNLSDEVINSFINDWYCNAYQYCNLKPETIEVLETLKDKFTLALISNGKSEGQWPKIKHTNVEPYFKEIIVSGDVGVHKPNKQIFEMMVEKLGLKASECLYVGDTFSNDIYGAINAGLDAVWMWTDNTRPSKQGIKRISNLKELYSILNVE